MTTDIIDIGPALAAQDEAALREAVRLLEHTSLASKVTEFVGRQVDFAGGLIPERARAIAGHAAHVALRGALRLALRSLDTPGASKLARSHKALAAVAGAAGGALGLAALPIELPASTIVMFPGHRRHRA